MDLYRHMGDQLRSLFQHLSQGHGKEVGKKMSQILITAHEIGSPIAQEAERLKVDLEKFLQNPGDPKLANIMKKHALRLEQETREL